MAGMLVLALLSVTPALALPDEETSTPEPPPATEEETSTAPVKPPLTEDPLPGKDNDLTLIPDLPDDSASEASAPETDSAIDIPVDEETEEFRRALAERQAAIEEFKAQLDELDRQLAISIEEYNAAMEELASTKDLLAMTETDLDKAREAYKEQAALLQARVSDLYRSGDLGALEILLDSKSMGDFFSRIVFLSVIGRSNAELASQLAGEKERIESDLIDLESAEAHAEALEFELQARQIEIMLRIEERQGMLVGAQVGLLEFLDEEAERRQIEQQTLLQAILSGAEDVGITIVPGSPVETALAYHGIPYLWGGEKPSGFDCSGLVLYVYRQHGVELPHYSGSQFLLGDKIMPQDLRPGDVVFFGSPVHHVGIYMGAGYYIHAPRTGDFVKVSRLLDRTDYAGARRYDWTPRVGSPVGVASTLTVVPTGL